MTGSAFLTEYFKAWKATGPTAPARCDVYFSGHESLKLQAGAYCKNQVKFYAEFKRIENAFYLLPVIYT